MVFQSGTKPNLARRGASTVPMLLSIDRSGPTPMHRQIYAALRAAILDQRLAAGTRLPSTRVLASDLRVSRTTVLGAYDQLIAEGYLVARHGGGTRVSPATSGSTVEHAPGQRARATRPQVLLRAPAREHETTSELSVAGTAMLGAYDPQGIELTLARRAGPRSWQPLSAGIPALDAFPIAKWARLTARRWRRDAKALLLPDDGAGYRPLREAIAAYVVTARAVRCTADQVIITAGAQQAIDLTARLLLNAGDPVWVEEPGYPPARAALATVGARLVEVPVDDEGLDVERGRAVAEDARLAFTTPSYQAPLGVVMSLRRRLALLDWAAAQRAWIIEDDYNGEFRYDGKPLASMQGLEHPGAARVIFLGTFSKALFPALRLGFAIVPPELADAFALARLSADRHSPLIEQAVLADFIAEGHFARHARRMRALYATRQAAFVASARRELGDLMRVEPAPAGMRLLGWLPTGVSDVQVADAARRRGVEVVPLSVFRATPGGEPALILGYAPFSASQTQRALRVIAECIRAATGSAARNAPRVRVVAE